MIDKLDAALRFHREALQLRAQRQELLAGNIAHADTPHFKARDIDFAAQLERVLQQGRGAGVPLAATSAQHLQGGAAARREAELLYRVPTQSSIDGNTVEMDVERVQFSENAVRYEMGVTVVSGRIKSLLAVLQQH